MEIATIVEDWRSQVVGGMESALTMWEACCIPTLLSGAGTWTEIQPAAERRLDALQNWFVRLILRVGPGCPDSNTMDKIHSVTVSPKGKVHFVLGWVGLRLGQTILFYI